MKTSFLIAIFALCSVVARADAGYADWKHTGSIFLLTTPEGTAMEGSASVDGFPVLVRLHKDFFDFGQAKAKGEDLRFATLAGEVLPYQIEEWDAAAGIASVWVRVLRIQGNSRQELKVFWGKPDAKSESNGSAVFNAANGYASVWHMNGPAVDEVGTLESKDVGTTPCRGIIGLARHFEGKQGLSGGERIEGYPTGSASHSTEAWFRAEKPNTTIVGWGNEGGGRGSKVRMQLRSPPHVRVDSDFSDVKGESTIPMSQWIHVAHTYEKGAGKIYVNGKLDGSATPTLAIKSPSRLWIGGWYNNYDFVGDIDEVRISRVVRSAAWVRLEYENQKPLQTLTGPIVQAGSAFSVSAEKLTVAEGKSATVTAKAGGAQQVYWILKSQGQESIVATNRFSYTFDAGRVTRDETATLQFKAVYAGDVKTLDISIAIKEAIPEPRFTLGAPAKWDGRTPIEVTPLIANEAEMRAAGAVDLHCQWTISGLAVIREEGLAKLRLLRAQNSGKMTIAATVDNGGQRVTQMAEVTVSEPATDAWLVREPAADEKPADSQFYARDDKNEGTLFYNGTLGEAADTVFLRVFADGKPFKNESQKLGPDHNYRFTVKLKPGLIQYKVEFGSRVGDREKVLDSVNNLVCGDAFLMNGQSNAVATSWGNEEYAFASPWIRSFGSSDGGTQGARLQGWAEASPRAKGGKAQIGYWAMELARRLVESQKIPICIINGAVGGTRIDQHQRNAADPEDVTTIYGRLLWRVRQAKLTHGIRGVLWHQGENDQGADGPTGGFGYENYRQYFVDMAAAWKQDFPNIQHYYIFQIWPRSCGMGINGSDNRLREVQRTLPELFSNMSIMSTLGIDPPGGCHYPPAGYAEIARLICPLVERDHYGKKFEASITPPNLKHAFFVHGKRDEVAMEFDQPVKWDDRLAGQFYLNGEAGKVISGSVQGKTVTLKLAAGTTGVKLTYLDSKSWSQEKLLRGDNGIAALTFCDVTILASPPADLNGR